METYEDAHRGGVEIGVGRAQKWSSDGKGNGREVEKEERRSRAGRGDATGKGGTDGHRDGDGRVEVVGEEQA